MYVESPPDSPAPYLSIALGVCARACPVCICVCDVCRESQRESQREREREREREVYKYVCGCVCVLGARIARCQARAPQPLRPTHTAAKAAAAALPTAPGVTVTPNVSDERGGGAGGGWAGVVRVGGWGEGWEGEGVCFTTYDVVSCYILCSLKLYLFIIPLVPVFLFLLYPAGPSTASEAVLGASEAFRTDHLHVSG